MANLSILLGDGFHDDQVIVKIDGDEVARKDHATSDLRISSAGSMNVPLSQPARLTVEVPKQGLAGVVEVDAGQSPFLAVTVDAGTLVFRKSERPFRLV